MNAPVIRHEQRQQQTLTPRLQQAVRLLQLSSLDFAQEVQQAIGNNPFLEPDEAEQQDANSAATSAAAPTAEVAAETPLTGKVTEVASVEPPPDNGWEGEGWSQYGNAVKNNGSEHDFDVGDITAADESLRDHLRSQLQLLSSTTRDRV